MPSSSYSHLQSSYNFSPLRRPPSLSDSFVFHEINIERAASFQKTIDEEPVKEKSVYEYNLVYNSLRCTFHICLISVFEILFFFTYVSRLENNGISGTFQSITTSCIDTCKNFTITEREVLNQLFYILYNSTNIMENGNREFIQRNAKNYELYVRSWIYTGSISGIFMILILYSCVRKHTIPWTFLIVENVGFVTILGLYEYMFFSTIVVPYSTIGGAEIIQSTVQTLQSSCGVSYGS